MAKPGAVRQREYEQRKKEEDKEAYLQKRRDQKREQRELLKANKEKYEAQKLKDRLREKKAVIEATLLTTVTSTSSSESSYSSRQSLGKAVAHTVRMLCKTPGKKKQILSKIVSTLSPCSKTTVCTSAWRKLDHNSILGWAKISSGLRETVISFLEKPDISYCKPGRKDMVYIGKDENGES